MAVAAESIPIRAERRRRDAGYNTQRRGFLDVFSIAEARISPETFSEGDHGFREDDPLGRRHGRGVQEDRSEEGRREEDRRAGLRGVRADLEAGYYYHSLRAAGARPARTAAGAEWHFEGGRHDGRT